MANALAWVTSGIQYIIQQDFESAGTPSGWTGNGLFTFHNTSSPLEGTGDLLINGQASPASFGIYNMPSTVNECWTVVMLKCVNLPSSNADWFRLLSSGGTAASFIRVDQTGALQYVNGDTGLVVPTGLVTAGTLYYLKMYYLIGSGSDSISTWELSTSGVWIGSGSFYGSKTNGPSTRNVGKLYCENNSTGEFRFDHIRMSSSDLGNSISNWV